MVYYSFPLKIIVKQLLTVLILKQTLFMNNYAIKSTEPARCCWLKPFVDYKKVYQNSLENDFKNSL